jgi:hypothetical protein
VTVDVDTMAEVLCEGIVLVLKTVEPRGLTSHELCVMFPDAGSLVYFALGALTHGGRVHAIGGYDRSKDLRELRWRLGPAREGKVKST